MRHSCTSLVGADVARFGLLDAFDRYDDSGSWSSYGNYRRPTMPFNRTSAAINHLQRSLSRHYSVGVIGANSGIFTSKQPMESTISAIPQLSGPFREFFRLPDREWHVACLYGQMRSRSGIVHFVTKGTPFDEFLKESSPRQLKFSNHRITQCACSRPDIPHQDANSRIDAGTGFMPVVTSGPGTARRDEFSRRHGGRWNRVAASGPLRAVRRNVCPSLSNHTGTV